MTHGYTLLASDLGAMTAIAAWQVDAARRERALARPAARLAFARLARGASFAQLCVLHREATGIDPNQLRGLSAAGLVSAIDAAIAAGKLLLFAGFPTGSGGELPAGDGDPSRPSDDAVLARKVMGRHSAIMFEGGRYRFVATGQRIAASADTDERPVRLAEASKIVAAMAEWIPRNDDERAAWLQLADRLTDDERADGIRLLRITFVAAAVAPEVVQATTPSAMRAAAAAQAAEKTWIEIDVRYEDGTPFAENIIVELPGGKKTEGAPDGQGIIRIDGIDPGSCKLSIPEAEASA